MHTLEEEIQEDICKVKRAQSLLEDVISLSRQDKSACQSELRLLMSILEKIEIPEDRHDEQLSILFDNNGEPLF